MAIFGTGIIEYLIANDWVIASLTIVAFVIIFVSLHYFVYNKIKREDFDEHEIIELHSMNAFVFYAILVAFSVVTAWDTYQKASANAQTEVDSLAGLYELSNYFPQNAKEKTEQNIIRYANLMINEEWPAMQKREDSPSAYLCANELLQAIVEILPTNDSETNLQSQALEVYTAFTIARRTRLYENVEPYPVPLLFALFIGAILTIPLSTFIRSKHKKRQLFMTGVISAFVALLLSTFLIFQTPYQGTITVPVVGWEKLLQDIQEHKLN